MAADEWYAYYRGGGMDEDRNISPALACFCNDLQDEEGGSATEMEFSTTDKKMVPTCGEIFDD
jgi:hypothetical protein